MCVCVCGVGVVCVCNFGHSFVLVEELCLSHYGSEIRVLRRTFGSERDDVRRVKWLRKDDLIICTFHQIITKTTK